MVDTYLIPCAQLIQNLNLMGQKTELCSHLLHDPLRVPVEICFSARIHSAGAGRWECTMNFWSRDWLQRWRVRRKRVQGA